MAHFQTYKEYRRAKIMNFIDEVVKTGAVLAVIVAFLLFMAYRVGLIHVIGR